MYHIQNHSKYKECHQKLSSALSAIFADFEKLRVQSWQADFLLSKYQLWDEDT